MGSPRAGAGEREVPHCHLAGWRIAPSPRKVLFSGPKSKRMKEYTELCQHCQRYEHVTSKSEEGGRDYLVWYYGRIRFELGVVKTPWLCRRTPTLDSSFWLCFLFPITAVCSASSSLSCKSLSAPCPLSSSPSGHWHLAPSSVLTCLLPRKEGKGLRQSSSQSSLTFLPTVFCSWCD